jgi:hypothetical protein
MGGDPCLETPLISTSRVEEELILVILLSRLFSDSGIKTIPMTALMRKVILDPLPWHGSTNRPQEALG